MAKLNLAMRSVSLDVVDFGFLFRYILSKVKFQWLSALCDVKFHHQTESGSDTEFTIAII